MTTHPEQGSRTGKWLFWVLAFVILVAGALIVLDSVDDSSLDEGTLAVPIDSLEKTKAKPVPAEDSSIGKSEGPYR